MIDRQRKTKAPCPECAMNMKFCLCDQIPRLDLKTKVVLVVHAKELKRTTNTGRLVVKSLVNSEMKVRGEDREGLDLSALLTDEYQTLLFYPSEDAAELTTEYMMQFQKPIQLIVPDGNWRQAGKVHYRHRELANVPRVMIKEANPEKHHLRKETTEFGMATLQAVACALGVIEGADVKNKLMDLYQVKLQRTLEGRGINFGDESGSESED